MGKEAYGVSNQVNLELTRASVKPKLEVGVVFMPDERKDQSNGPEQPAERPAQTVRGRVGGRRPLSQASKVTKILDTITPGDVQDQALSAWREFYAGRAMLPGEQMMVERLAKAGILPKPEQREDDGGLIDDFKAIAELPDGELSSATIGYLKDFSKELEKRIKNNEPVQISLTDSFRAVLLENGISSEVIERNSSHPEKLMQMLTLRARILNEKQMAKSVSPDTDDQDERPLPEVVPQPVITPEPEPFRRSEQDLAVELEEQRRQRKALYEQQVASLRTFFTGDPEALKGWVDAFEREGRSVPNVETIIASILPFDKAEEQIDRDIQIRAHKSELARSAWARFIGANKTGITPQEKASIEMLIERGITPIEGASLNNMPDAQRQFMETILGTQQLTAASLDNVAAQLEALTALFGRSEGVSADTQETYRRKEWGRDIYVPKSLEQLTELVMNRADPEYRVDRGDGQRGEYCLFNFRPQVDDGGQIVRDAEGEIVYTNEIASVNTVNFLRWARDNYLKVHLTNPLAEVNFFSDIATNVKTEGFGSALSFYELTFTESYFFKETVGEDGKLHIEKDPEYDALRNQILMEIYLLMIQRNPAVSYVTQQRAEREKMINAIVAANIVNPLTRDNFAEMIFTAPSTEARSALDMATLEQKKAALGMTGDDIDNVDLLARIEGNAAMGTATREAIAYYVNIADWENIVKIMGIDSVLFKYEYDTYDEWSGQKDKDGRKKHTAEDPDPEKRGKRKKEWFYSKEEIAYLESKGVLARLQAEGRSLSAGDVKLFKLSRGKFVSAELSYGDKKGKTLEFKPGDAMPTDEEIRGQHPSKLLLIDRKTDSKGLVTIVARELDPFAGAPHPDFMKYLNVYLTPTPDVEQQKEMRERVRLAIMERNGISYREAQIAELMAFSMSQINGVAARADVDSVGFDWWTRVTNFLDKRKREKSGDRDAPYGADYNMEGVKRIGLNFFEAARDRSGRSIRKIIQGGAKSSLGGKYKKWGEGGEIHITEDPLKNIIDYEYTYERDASGNIKFLDVNEENALDSVALGVREVGYDPKGKRLIYRDAAGNEVDVKRAVPIKDSLVLKYASDGEGHAKGEIKDIGAKVVRYSLEKDGVKFFDESGRDVTDLVGEDRPDVRIVKVDTPLEFEVDIQKQFLPNHLMTAAQIYKWVFSMSGYHLDRLVKGRDPRGFPILDHKAVDEIKHGINHDIRYAISTWGKINFAERHREWEQVEIRDSKGYLVDPDGNRLDEETFQILKPSRIPFQPMVKTGNKSDPAKFLRVREMSRLESMFAAPALIFIKAELARRGLDTMGLDGKPIAGVKSADDLAHREGVNADIIYVEDEITKEHIALNISAATAKEGEFRKAVFQGVIDYYIASELREERAFGTGHHHIGYLETTDAKDAVVIGKIMDPARMDIISKEIGIETYKMYWEYFSRETAAGSLDGFWKSLSALVKATVS